MKGRGGRQGFQEKNTTSTDRSPIYWSLEIFLLKQRKRNEVQRRACRPDRTGHTFAVAQAKKGQRDIQGV